MKSSKNTENPASRSVLSSQNTKQQSIDCSKSCSTSLDPLIVKIPVRLVSEGNMRQHWTKAHKRKKDVQRTIILFLQPHKKPSLPCRITLTRIAPRSLDMDNLATCLKSSIDCIADWLLPGMAAGRADGDVKLEFMWDQRKGDPKEYALEVSFSAIPE